MFSTFQLKLTKSIILLSLITLLNACNIFEVSSPNAKIQRGNEQEIVNSTISINGSEINVNLDTLKGMKIKVEANSYPENRNLRISTIDIKSHNFGPNFNPISPIIHFDNGGGYSSKPLILKIPIKIPSTKFAMAYMYDPNTEELEGMPILSSDTSSITVFTNHFDFTSVQNSIAPMSKLNSTQTTNKFAEIIISAIDKAYLDNTEARCDFLPGIDDWEFTNYGSIESPYGICAGMSASSMWYYDFKKKNNGQLFSKYETLNSKLANGEDKFWFDNTKGIIFASRTQTLYEKNNSTPQGEVNFQKYFLTFANQWRDQYRAFAYSLLLTNKPQQVAISRNGGGHAMVIYKVKNGEMFVSDPNKPSKLDRRINFNLNTGLFSPYIAGSDASGNQVEYPQIYYIARSAILNFPKIAEIYKEATNHNSSKNIGCFPNYQIWVKDGSGYELGDKLTTDLDSLPIELRCPTCPNNISNFTYTIIDDKGNLKANSKSNALKLNLGENNLGFYIEASSSKDCSGGAPFNPESAWVDFRWIKVTYNSVNLSIDPIALNGNINNEYTFNAILSNPPKNANYIWNFGDNSSEQSISNNKTIKHSFSKNGTFSISLKLYDADKNIKLAEASSIAVIASLPSGDPEISKITPDSTSPEGEIKIYGKNFGNSIDKSYVEIGNTLYLDSLDIVSWSDNQITAKIPTEAEYNCSIKINRKLNSEAYFNSSNSLDIKLVPSLKVTLKRCTTISSKSFRGVLKKVNSNTTNDISISIGQFDKTKPILWNGNVLTLKRRDYFDKKPGQEIYTDFDINLNANVNGNNGSLSGSIKSHTMHLNVAPDCEDFVEINISNLKLYKFDFRFVSFQAVDNEANSVISYLKYWDWYTHYEGYESMKNVGIVFDR